MSLLQTQPVEAVLREAIDHAAHAISEPIIEQAVADFEKALRREVATVALEVSRWYSFEWHGDTLRIEVRIGHGK